MARDLLIGAVALVVIVIVMIAARRRWLAAGRLLDELLEPDAGERADAYEEEFGGRSEMAADAGRDNSGVLGSEEGTALLAVPHLPSAAQTESLPLELLATVTDAIHRAERLTPRQRRRAVHKRRVPHDLPGRPSSTDPRSPAGEYHHERHERHVTLAQAEAEAAQLLDLQAFEAWEAEMGMLIGEAYNWYRAGDRCWAGVDTGIIPAVTG